MCCLLILIYNYFVVVICSNVDKVCWWEFMVFVSYMYLLVVSMVRMLLFGVNVVYLGDLLCDFVLGVFLD